MYNAPIDLGKILDAAITRGDLEQPDPGASDPEELAQDSDLSDPSDSSSNMHLDCEGGRDGLCAAGAKMDGEGGGNCGAPPQGTGAKTLSTLSATSHQPNSKARYEAKKRVKYREKRAKALEQVGASVKLVSICRWAQSRQVPAGINLGEFGHTSTAYLGIHGQGFI
ncbi:hypothetical protein PTI98_009043 [Pleurotus ostreatus]|nr:hypothetical protein PTI98_009043 [Pleurotus ostreatus]